MLCEPIALGVQALGAEYTNKGDPVFVETMSFIHAYIEGSLATPR